MDMLIGNKKPLLIQTGWKNIYATTTKFNMWANIVRNTVAIVLIIMRQEKSYLDFLESTLNPNLTQILLNTPLSYSSLSILPYPTIPECKYLLIISIFIYFSLILCVLATVFMSPNHVLLRSFYVSCLLHSRIICVHLLFRICQFVRPIAIS